MVTLFCGCVRESNPDIRYLLNLANARSHCDELYRQFKGNVKTPGVSIAKYHEKRKSFDHFDVSEYNPFIPVAETFDSRIVVHVYGREWSYEAEFFFTENDVLAAVNYGQCFSMPPPESKPIDWHMKW